jgi:crotonobetainyl-CoA:carnitine CoA-transferase CaiB-like acyl-CoA transferase
MFVEVEHPVAGKIKITGDHIKFSDKKAEVRMPSPTLGQHNFEVYGDVFGLSEETIKEYIEKGVF